MQIIGSFLKWLWSIISGGIHVGDKTDNRKTNDSSKKNLALGKNNTVSETNIGTQNNTIINLPDSAKAESLLSYANPPSKDLLDQADSLMRQIAEKKEERLLVFRQYGRIVRIRFVLSKMDYQITDKVAIPEVLKFLKEHGYLDNSWNDTNNTRHIYDLTLKGREYGKKLLEENRGSTSI
ncbi:MAG: hypothetical protein IKO02_03375 [Lentisphaeria bacterium]|nr:hypothetical protein [Lentisphaeria bacterium]